MSGYKSYYKSGYKKYCVFVFALALSALSGRLDAQTSPQITRITETKVLTFECKKTTPVDLFKVMGVQISPSIGYWGDINGLPYDGMSSSNFDIKERPLTSGSIFNPADTGTYTFYFYVTTQKEYCGITQGMIYELEIYVDIASCMVFGDELSEDFKFCYGTLLDRGSDRNGNIKNNKYDSNPIQIADLLFSKRDDADRWKDPRDPDGTGWSKIEVYSDSIDRKPGNIAAGGYLGDGKHLIYTESDGSTYIDPSVTRRDTLYLIVYPPLDTNGKPQSPTAVNVPISIFKQERLKIEYDPYEINAPNGREFDINDNVTIFADVDDVTAFSDISYYLNKKYLNRYYFGSDTVVSSEITVPAMIFNGAMIGDYVEIVANDKNNCMVKAEGQVYVDVPFPTVFTPDGDGINDVLFGGEKFRNREFHLEVYNRWGNQLYFGESGWDGKYQGKDVPAGVYFYVLDIKTISGKTTQIRRISSSVALIRNKR
ncbi:MAG: gliding motility-associated C-terminal domain-containing protein [Prevotellaceae bacterium]|jgi:gliding motility-associated-like protein|nr:gliding motility-associated C-terminal domain-containing protein [Prevotellaceae bacterium]